MICQDTNYYMNITDVMKTDEISSQVRIQTDVCPSDSRVAYAIRSGLIEMCLSFMERFSDPTELLKAHIENIFRAIYSVSLHRKSAKAIRRKKGKIEEKLMQLGQDQVMSSNAKCMELIDIVRSILDLNGAYCCCCNMSLGRKDIKRCNGCDRMTYCSVDCQKEDWLNGHNLTCFDKCYTDEWADQFQGRYWPITLPRIERDVAKMKALEINITMVQLKLYLDNAENILNQARSLDIPLHDCVVMFDIRQCPPTVEVRYNEYCAAESIKGFEDTRSKENITCLYISYYDFGSLEVSPFVMQRLFPHERLFKECQSKHVPGG